MQGSNSSSFWFCLLWSRIRLALCLWVPFEDCCEHHKYISARGKKRGQNQPIFRVFGSELLLTLSTQNIFSVSPESGQRIMENELSLSVGLNFGTIFLVLLSRLLQLTFLRKNLRHFYSIRM